jgi:predicted nucleotidyltransferase
MSEKKIKDLALKYKNTLLRNGVPVSGIYLFGSHARGIAKVGSDIDFCVISSSFGKNDFQEMVKINQLAKITSPEIEAFPVSVEDFGKRTNPFINEAIKTGKKIV